MFHVFDNVMYVFDCQNLCITMWCMFFYIFHSFCCYNMNLYFGPAALHYIINNILSSSRVAINESPKQGAAVLTSSVC